MVDWWLFARSFLVPLAVNALVTLLLVGWVYTYRMVPLFDLVQEKIEVAEKAIKTGMSAMGQKSGQVRLDASVEGAVAKDMLNAQLPEAEFFLSLLSADTRELVEDNPEAVLRLAAKYFPAQLKGMGQAQTEQGADFG